MRLSALTKQRAKDNFAFIVLCFFVFGGIHIAWTIIAGLLGIDRGY